MSKPPSDLWQVIAPATGRAFPCCGRDMAEKAATDLNSHLTEKGVVNPRLAVIEPWLGTEEEFADAVVEMLLWA